MRSLHRLLTVIALVLAAALLPVASAEASHSQVTMLQEDNHLLSDPFGTMQRLSQLGVQEARVFVEWSYVAPANTSTTKPANFDSASSNSASSDGATDGYHWARYDNIVRAAQQYHVKLDFLLSGGAPYWAENWPAGQARDIHFAYQPSVTEWGDFVHAVVAKYGGSVHAWEIYNEPNFGEDLGPQITQGVYVGVEQYRAIVDAAWRVFSALHHTHDQITVGQLTARHIGGSYDNEFGQSEPLIFLRDLYCVGSNLKVLSGTAAKNAGCPTTSAGQHAFAAAHPGLFHSSGVGIHPYPQGLPPTRDSSRDPNYLTFNQIPRLESTLDGIDRTYHVHGRMSVYNNEYGYVTHPPNPNRLFASPATAAVYINEAEYLSWRDPRLASYDQYLLYDPGANTQFFSGLIDPNGRAKATFYAFRMPLWLPSSVVRRGRSAEVWGAARPAATLGNHGRVSIEWRSSSRSKFKVIARVSPSRGTGYFDAAVRFPGSGQVQTAWAEPGVGTITSRIATVRVG